MVYDFEGLDLQLLGSARELLPQWFPNGRFVGSEFHVGSIRGEAGDSLKVARSGAWKDFASDEPGGPGLISLYARMNDIPPGEAYLKLGGRRPNGGLHPKPVTPQTTPASATSYRYATWDDYTSAEFVHARYGKPALTTPYEVLDNGQWRVALVVCRWEPPDGAKEILPYTWSRSGWRSKQAPKPWPLYGHRRLDANPSTTVLVVEGEKCAHAAEGIWRSSPIVTWPGGSSAHEKADWEPLRGRSVILWPDLDPPGEKAMWAVGERLVDMGCKCQYISGGVAADRPKGWDAADAIAEMGDNVKQWVSDNLRDFPPPRVTPTAPDLERTELTEGRPPLEQPELAPRFHVEHSTVGELWREWELQVGPRGPHANLSNAQRALEAVAQKGYQALPYYDSFKNRLLVNEAQPDGTKKVSAWTDVHDTQITAWLQRNAGLHHFRRSILIDAIRAHAVAHGIDSYADWLNGLVWDGTARLEMLFTDGFGAPVNDYCKAVGRCFMIGLVARGLAPGCQVDNMPVLEGAQGVGKSSALRIIGGPFFAEVHTEIGTHRWQEVVQGIALAELSEMQSFSTAKNEMIKAAITNCVDRYRPAYGRDVEDRPRRVVFVATTNQDYWLTDPTGGRRFWPIRCGRIDLDWLRDVRDQLFAEAVQRYRAGVHWWDVPIEAAAEEQAARSAGDDWDEVIASRLYGQDRTTTFEIARHVIDLELREIDPQTSRRIGGILRRFGWHTQSSQGVRYWTPGHSLRAWRKKHPGEPRIFAVTRGGVNAPLFPGTQGTEAPDND